MFSNEAVDFKPCKGAIALCGAGTIGLITEDEPREITYSDGNKSVAYVGIQLTDAIAPIGSPWSSRDPKILARLMTSFPSDNASGYALVTQMDFESIVQLLKILEERKDQLPLAVGKVVLADVPVTPDVSPTEGV